MIEIENLVKTYETGQTRTEVLKGISFRVGKGEYAALMGASGTGKSTLLNILGGLDKPTSGRYLLDGEDMVNVNDDTLSRLRNRKIGFVFQQFHLLDRANVHRNVLLPFLYADGYPADARERAERAVAAVGLADRISYRPSQLSGGQQQRVAIARALVGDPALLLADEPTGNLDARNGAEVLAIFQRLNREGRTIVLVTHDAAVAEHAGRVLVMRDGRIVEDRKVTQPRDAEAELRAIPVTP